MKKLLFLSAIILAAVACNKPDSSKPTGACATGTLKIVNDSADIYAVFIDTVYNVNMGANLGGYQMSLNPGDSHYFTLDTGTWYYNTKQVSGSRTMPDTEPKEGTIQGCDTLVYHVI